MQTVKIKAKRLAGILKKNRETHLKDYNEAMVEYRKTAINELIEIMTAAEGGAPFKRCITAPEPVSYVGSYDTAIRMLELSEDDVVELTAGEFSQYVEDKWDWQRQFVASTMIYKK